MDNSSLAMTFVVIVLACFALAWVLPKPWKRYWSQKNAEQRRKVWEARKARQAHSTCDNLCGRLANAANRVIVTTLDAEHRFKVRRSGWEKGRFFWQSKRPPALWFVQVVDCSKSLLPKLHGREDLGTPVVHISLLPERLDRAVFRIWTRSGDRSTCISGELDFSTEAEKALSITAFAQHLNNTVGQCA